MQHCKDNVLSIYTYQMQKQIKEAAFVYHQGFICEQVLSPPTPQKIIH